MRIQLTPSQQQHFNKTRELLAYLDSPELQSESQAVKDAAELGFLQHSLQGFRSIQDPGVYPEGHHAAGKSKDRFYYKDGGYKKKPLELATVDSAGMLDQQEELELQLMEVKNALSMGEEVPEKFAQFSPQERALITEIYRRQVGQGSRTSVGMLGLSGRVFPADHPQAGQKIPFSMTPEYRNKRSEKLALDQIGGVEPDMGIGLYGGATDAMHRVPAAKAPERIALIENIKQGLSSLNQSDGKRTGEALRQSRLKRKVNLDDQLFFLENGVPNTHRGTFIPEGASPELTKLVKAQASEDRRDNKIVANSTLEERREELARQIALNQIERILAEGPNL